MGERTSVVCSAKLGYLIALVKSFSTANLPHGSIRQPLEVELRR
jgi:hypothetical protein